MRAGEQGEDTTQFEARLLAQYGRGGETDKTSLTDDVSQIVPFLSGKKLNIAGFDEELSQVRKLCP